MSNVSNYFWFIHLQYTSKKSFMFQAWNDQMSDDVICYSLRGNRHAASPGTETHHDCTVQSAVCSWVVAEGLVCCECDIMGFSLCSDFFVCFLKNIY